MIIVTNTLPGILRMLGGVRSRSLLPIPFPFSYEWDKTKEKFTPKESYKHLWIISFVIYLAAAISQIILKVVKNDMKLWEKVQGTYFVIGYTTMALCFIMFHRRHFKDICYFLNQLMGFEQRHLERGDKKEQDFWRNRESKLASLLGQLLDDSFRFLTAVVPVIAALYPTSPWHPLAFVVVSLCPPNIVCCISALYRIFIYVEYYLFWRWGMDVIVSCHVVNFIISLYALKCCIIGFLRLVNSSKTKSEFRQRILIYREIQLLIQFYNEIHKSSLMIGLIIVTLSITVTFTYLGIGNFRELDALFLASCVVLSTTESLQIVFGFGYAAKVYHTSCSTNREISDVIKSTESGTAWTNRFWKSCQVLKIQFGNDSFFDKSTPLVFLQFCVDQTANLILLK